jgi:transketolase
VLECNGNDISSLLECLQLISWSQKPTFIIAHTTMGKGVKSIENNHLWHGKAPNMDEAQKFLIELDEYYKEKYKLLS